MYNQKTGLFVMTIMIFIFLSVQSVFASDNFPEMVLVKGGIHHSERDNKDIEINYDFEMSKYEITISQYIRYSHPEHQRDDENMFPARVNWADAAAYCNWLSKLKGYEPAYKEETWELKDSSYKLEGYRLPTGKEWEYAARGGKDGKDYIYAGSNNISEVAWYGQENYNYEIKLKSPLYTKGDASGPTELHPTVQFEQLLKFLKVKYKSYIYNKQIIYKLLLNQDNIQLNHLSYVKSKFSNIIENDNFVYHNFYPVGLKKANELGIFDMSGNVSEWCNDKKEEDTSSEDPSLNLLNIVFDYPLLAGGDIFSNTTECEVSGLDYIATSGSVGYGLRVVRTIHKP